MAPHGNGWDEYQRLVIFRLEKLEEEVKGLRTDVIGLRLNAAKWGALAGGLLALLTRLL